MQNNSPRRSDELHATESTCYYVHTFVITDDTHATVVKTLNSITICTMTNSVLYYDYPEIAK
ncbi:MAG: hypothetical protein WCK15_06915 [Pirellula sp.]